MRDPFLRFGELAVAKGLVHIEVLLRAFNEQQRQRMLGERIRPLGQVLIEHRLITARDVDRVLEEMGLSSVAELSAGSG